jgi:hypothetical protein
MSSTQVSCSTAHPIDALQAEPWLHRLASYPGPCMRESRAGNRPRWPLPEAALLQVEQVPGDCNHWLAGALRRLDHKRNALGVHRAEGKDFCELARSSEAVMWPDGEIAQGPVELRACSGEKDARSDETGIAEQLRPDDGVQVVQGTTCRTARPPFPWEDGGASVESGRRDRRALTMSHGYGGSSRRSGAT